MNIEPTQEYFLRVMQNIGFTDEQIEENRKHNGRLLLTPAVVIGAMLGDLDPGVRIDTRRGDIA